VRILADENVETAIVGWLRSRGHDVLWVAEELVGTRDAELIPIAQGQERVLLTSDLDFGELVFRYGARTSGVVLLRLRAPTEAQLLNLFRKRWDSVEPKAAGHFTVVSNRRIRVRPLT